MKYVARPEQVVQSIRSIDGRRVALVREETYQTALRAARKALRDDQQPPRAKIVEPTR